MSRPLLPSGTPQLRDRATQRPINRLRSLILSDGEQRNTKQRLSLLATQLDPNAITRLGHRHIVQTTGEAQP